jgi:hypothetical protein
MTPQEPKPEQWEGCVKFFVQGYMLIPVKAANKKEALERAGQIVWHRVGDMSLTIVDSYEMDK